MEKLINSLQFHRKLLELSITELSRENVDLISQIEEIESAEGRDSGLLQILKMQQLFLESIISQRQDEMKKFNDHVVDFIETRYEDILKTVEQTITS